MKGVLTAAFQEVTKPHKKRIWKPQKVSCQR